MDFSKGALLAVHVTGEETDTTSFMLQYAALQNVMIQNSFEFLDLAASPVPSPKPSFERGQGMEDKGVSGDQNALSDWQYMILGAFFGVVATVIHYKLAQFYYDYMNRMPGTCVVITR